jgi:hypothetical protein
MPFKRVSIAALAAVVWLASLPVSAAASYMTGRIIDITFTQDWMMIRLDTGLPDNCIGTAYGWMKIPAESKPMTAFAMGLWLRGDNTQVDVTVYTSGIVDGYCRITQIDPVG